MVKEETIHDEGDNINFRLLKCLQDVGTKIFLFALKYCCGKSLKDILSAVHSGTFGLNTHEVEKAESGKEEEFDINMIYKLLKSNIHSTSNCGLLRSLEKIKRERTELYHLVPKYSYEKFLYKMNVFEDLFSLTLGECQFVCQNILNQKSLPEVEKYSKQTGFQEMQTMISSLPETIDKIKFDKLECELPDFKHIQRESCPQRIRASSASAQLCGIPMETECQDNSLESFTEKILYNVPPLRPKSN